MKEPKDKTHSSYRWYVLTLLTIVTTFTYLDHHLIVILQESIKAEMGFSDAQLGLVTGFAFALSFTIFSIPVAHLADQYSRKNIISIALATWSGITAFTGFAGNFWQMFLARFGVGLGETGSAPPALSMISDYFPKEERGRAFAIRSMGIYFGLLLGFLVGGLIEEAYGWRTAFFVVGTPGVLFALIFYYTIKEPLRGRLDPDRKELKERASIKEVLQATWKKKTLVFMTIGAGLHVLVGAAFAAWMAPFFARIHGMGTAEIGMWLAFAIGVCGAFGTFLGGYLGDKMGQKDVRWFLWIPIISFALSFPFAIGVLFSEDKLTALLFYLMPNVLYAFYIGPAYTILQDLVEVRMRATANGIFLTFVTLCGTGMGPFLAGYLSDVFAPSYGVDSLRWALLAIGSLEWAAILFLLLATRSLKRDLAKL